MTITEAQLAVDQWIKKYGVRYFSELTNLACLTEEVGELARVIARTWRTELQGWRKIQFRGGNGRRTVGSSLPSQPNGCKSRNRITKKH